MSVSGSSGNCTGQSISVRKTNMETFFSKGDGEDPGYVNVRDAKEGFCADGRAFTEQLWPHFSHYADSNFLREAKDNFTERFWEMYLGCTLLDCGFDIGTPGDEGPDLYADVTNKRVWFEATAPSAGTGDDQVPEPIPGRVVAVPENQILLRLTGAIDAKRQHFEKAEKQGKVSKHDSAVICINGRNIPHSISDYVPHRIVRAVFPIGNPTVTLDRETLQVVDSGFEVRHRVEKTSGTEIPTTGFIDGSLARVSAVIYSRVDCANHPSRLGDDFVCVHNSNTYHPLPIGFLGRGLEYYAVGDTLRWLDHSVKRRFFSRLWHRVRTCYARLRYSLYLRLRTTD